MTRTYLCISILITGFLMAGNAYGEDEVYYCAETDKNGFQFDEKLKKYVRSGFHSEKFKMQIDISSNTLVLVHENRDREEYICSFPYSKKHDLMSCTSNAYHFHYNFKKGRFAYFKGYGYVGNFDNDSLTVSYGTCDKF